MPAWFGMAFFGLGCVASLVGRWFLLRADQVLDRAIELNRDTKRRQEEQMVRHGYIMDLAQQVSGVTVFGDTRPRAKEVN